DCTNKPDASEPVACKANFAGNYTECEVDQGACTTLARSGDSWSLAFKLKSTSGVGIQAQFDLGASPAVGTFGPDTIYDWTAVGVGSAPCAKSVMGDCAMVCAYTAGNGGATSGSFFLSLTSVDVSSATPAAHGALEVTQIVEAGLGVDCGRGDTEELAVLF